MPFYLYEPKPNVNQVYHVDSNLNEYFGEAPRATLTSEARWRIYKIEYATAGDQDSSWQIKYPNGSDLPAFEWDDVETYSYSLLKARS
jgi:hypothetical protein